MNTDVFNRWCHGSGGIQGLQDRKEKEMRAKCKEPVEKLGAEKAKMRKRRGESNCYLTN